MLDYTSSLSLLRPVVPMEYMGEEYFKLKASIIKYERFILKVGLQTVSFFLSMMQYVKFTRTLALVFMSSIHTRQE